MDLLLDFETYSEVDLKNCGATKYTTHPSFKILCMAYKEFDPVTLTAGQTKIWTFQEDFIINLKDYDFYWALNATFDFNVYLNSSLKSGVFLSSDTNKWKDVQVVLSKFSLPQSLAEAAEVLNTPIKKNPRGNLIIKQCCKKNSSTPTQANYQELFDYCITDVDATFEVLKACPSTKITENEWDLWRETFAMNHRGLPIQYDAVTKIKERCDAYKEVICDSLPSITEGKVTKPTQTKRIKDYLNSQGVKVENTTADTLEKLIDKDDKEPFLPENCRMLIEARQAAGASSVAKFDKLLDMRVGDRVHDFLRYGATNTQRWAGAGYQVHSLPKKSVENPEELIERFLNFGDIENPIQSAKALCRSVIQAPPGQRLYQGDFSSIEYLLLIWITDMQDKLQLFKDGKSAYIDMAAYLFNKKYEEIDKFAIDNLEYFLGKQVVLGCGYQMGAKKFKETCAGYGVDIESAEATRAVNGYRTMYKPIKKLWDDVHKACVAATLHQGTSYKTNRCEFVVLPDKRKVKWLIITLPSSTKLYYHSPELSQGKYGHELKHMGLSQYKWVRRYLSPGRITENIIQKLARDLMGYSILQVKDSPQFELLMTVHDELSALGTDEDPERQHKELIGLMELTPSWAEDLPLRAGGFFGTRYKKD